MITNSSLLKVDLREDSISLFPNATDQWSNHSISFDINYQSQCFKSDTKIVNKKFVLSFMNKWFFEQCVEMRVPESGCGCRTADAQKIERVGSEIAR